MGLIKRIAIFLARQCKLKFYKYASTLIIYALLLLIALISEECFKIKHFNYLLVNGMLISGCILYGLYKKLFRGIAGKILFLIFILSICFGPSYYYYEKRFFIQMLNSFKTINDIIYNSRELEFNILSLLICSFLPAITFLLLYLEDLGLGYIIMFLSSLFMIDIWLNGFENSIPVFMAIYFFLIILYSPITMYRRFNVRFKKAKIHFNVDRNKIITYSIAAAIGSLTMSYSFVGIFGNSNLEEVIDKFKRKFVVEGEIGRQSLYDLSYSGYDTKRLGGPITLDEGIAFRVESDKPYYLRGKAKDIYDGYSWKSSSDDLYKKGNKVVIAATEDYVKYMTGFNNRSNGGVEEKPKLNPKKITIYPEGLKSSTLFTPYNTFNIKEGKDTIGFTRELTFLLLNKSSPQTFYTIDFYESTIGAENFIKGKEKGLTLNYETESKNDKEIEYYEKNIKKPYGLYLEVPENITPRTKELVKNIIRDCSNSTEKVHAIYNYLSQNYTYSLDVSDIPVNTEFLDYFLFTEKKGYCTYFATAATIFCRLAGIPARYMEGFNMKELKDQEGLYIVGNASAHAWCEILVSGELNIWSVLDCVPVTAYVPIGERSKIPDNSAIIQWQLQNRNTNKQDEPMVTSLEENGQFVIQRSKQETKHLLRNILLKTIIMLPIILLILLITYLIFKVYSKKQSIKKMLNHKGATKVYEYSKERLKKVGVYYKPSDTELEYVNRIQDAVLKLEVEKAIEAYNLECFSNGKSEEFDSYSYYSFIENYIRGKHSKFKYIWYRYFSK